MSTISRSFFHANLSHLPVVPVNELLTVEVAGGSSLPFDGYVVLDFTVSFSNTTHTALFLVVPDTAYNEKVPVLIGTNVLSMFLSAAQQVQSLSGLPKAWSMALQVTNDRDGWFKEHTGFVGFGRSLEKITLQPNSQAVLECELDRGCSYVPWVLQSLKRPLEVHSRLVFM